MSYFFQLIRTYKWSISLALFVFIFCVLVASFGVGITLIVLLLTAVAGLFGFLKDRNLKLADLIRTIK